MNAGITYLGNSEFLIHLGDELHYLLKCKYFNEKRKTCLDKKKLNANTLKFGALMNPTNN